MEQTYTISFISDDETSVWSSANEMDQPTSGTELEETLVPELKKNLGSLKLSSEGELRKAKNRGKKLKRRAMLQAANAAVVARNSTEEARKLILSKTLQNQKNKMKRKAKKANSVSKPNMAESAKTIHQVSLILKKRQRSDDQATPETERKNRVRSLRSQRTMGHQMQRELS